LVKNDKIVIVKDGSGEDVELIFSYPKLKDSNYFWDTLMTLTKTLNKIDDSKYTETTIEDVKKMDSVQLEQLLTLSKELLPDLTNYICNNIEYKKNIKLTDSERDYYYQVVLINMSQIIIEFTNLFKNMFPKQQEQS